MVDVLDDTGTVVFTWGILQLVIFLGAGEAFTWGRRKLVIFFDEGSAAFTCGIRSLPVEGTIVVTFEGAGNVEVV